MAFLFSPLERRALDLEHSGKPIQKLSHARRQSGGNFFQCRSGVVLERGPNETFHESPAEVERSQLAECEPGILQAFQALAHQPTPRAAIELFVNERKSSVLQRGDISPDCSWCYAA